MHSPSETIHRWLCSPRVEESAHVRAAYRQVGRYEDEAAQHWMSWSSDDFENFLQMIDQQRLPFEQEDVHENVRRSIARYLDTVVAPRTADPAIRKLSTKLREARQTGTIMYRKEDRKFITMWDSKAGLPLLCPDDAREEAMRVQRRVVPAVMEALKQKGARAYSCVFTVENSAPGKLRAGMRNLSRKLRSLIRKCKRDGSLPILGAYAVMESPLGGYRTWHPHLNVILITSGWFDYAKLRALWCANVHVERLTGSEDSIEAALRELIKYSVRAVPEKSQAKAAAEHGEQARRGYVDNATASKAGPNPGGGDTPPGSLSERPPAPAMIEWTADEFTEWWSAHKGFRRSRGYGCLYRVDDPEPDSIAGFEAVGTVKHEGTKLVRRFTLLESIPGDKSSTGDLRERLKSHIRRLTGPPDRHRQALDVMNRALQAWPDIQNQLH